MHNALVGDISELSGAPRIHTLSACSENDYFRGLGGAKVVMEAFAVKVVVFYPAPPLGRLSTTNMWSVIKSAE